MEKKIETLQLKTYKKGIVLKKCVRILYTFSGQYLFLLEKSEETGKIIKL